MQAVRKPVLSTASNVGDSQGQWQMRSFQREDKQGWRGSPLPTRLPWGGGRGFDEKGAFSLPKDRFQLSFGTARRRMNSKSARRPRGLVVVVRHARAKLIQRLNSHRFGQSVRFEQGDEIAHWKGNEEVFGD